MSNYDITPQFTPPFAQCQARKKIKGSLRSQSFKLLPGDRQSGMIPTDIIGKTCFQCCWCTPRKSRSAETIHLLSGTTWANLASRRCTVCTYTGLSGGLQGWQGLALHVKYQSRGHLAAHRGSLSVGAPESLQRAFPALMSHAAACRGGDAILPVHILSNL